MLEITDTYYTFLLLDDVLYLPCLYTDACHCALHINIPDSDIRNTGFGVESPQTAYTDAMSGPTVDIVDVYV